MHREKPDSGKSPGAFGAGLGLGLLSAVSNILLFAGPLFMLQIYDRVLSSKSVPTLAALTGLIVVLYGFYSLVEIVRARMATRYCMLASSRMTRPVFSRLLVSHARPNQQTGTDPVNDVDIVRQFLGSAAPLALLDLPWVPVFLFVVFAFHPFLGWLAIAGAGVVAVLMVLNEWLAHGPSRQTNDAAMGRRAQQIDVTINAESVLAMGMGRAMSDRWEEASNTLMTSQIRAADRATVFSALTKSSRLLLQSAVLAMGAFLAIGGDISPGLMIAASIMTARALSPIEQAVTNWRSFVQARQARKRLKALLADYSDATDKAMLPLPSKTLIVSDLCVGIGREAPPMIGGVNFALHAGEAMGVVGLSGAGKSSLVRTLIGVWPALSGAIRFDGSEMGHFDPDRLGKAIGYLPQTVDLFEGTVAQNIARFDPDADFQEVLKAADAAGVHDMVAGLPTGYDTQIGRHGQTLSAGQRQRVGLARALYGDPFVIVLDEPNANLDAAGDAACNAAIVAAKARGAIVIIVAHRPTAIAAVDKILFLQDGRQAAFGPKDTVMAAITAQPTSIEVARKARVK
jgi:ATP-binding cassette, subfamily C, bacterial PrsD